MIPINFNALREIAKIQAARRKNWTTGEPADEKLEERHKRKLSSLMKKLQPKHAR